MRTWAAQKLRRARELAEEIPELQTVFEFKIDQELCAVVRARRACLRQYRQPSRVPGFGRQVGLGMYLLPGTLQQGSLTRALCIGTCAESTELSVCLRRR